MIRDEFIREAKVLRVVDGDTYDLMVSLGFGSYISVRVRLAGADTWEMRGENKEAGRLAKEHVKGLTRATAGRVLLRSTEYKKGKYGRTIGDVTSVIDGTDWGDSLKENGHVKRT